MPGDRAPPAVATKNEGRESVAALRGVLQKSCSNSQAPRSEKAARPTTRRAACIGSETGLRKRTFSSGLPRSATEMEIKGEPDHAASPLQQALIDF